MHMMSIINRVYSNSHFASYLIMTVAFLSSLFIIVLLLGLKDSKKSKQPKKVEELKDITFDKIEDNEMDNIPEEVTFEVPSLTENLENFKKSLEDELQKDQSINIALLDTDKPFKVTEISELEDTVVIPYVNETIDQAENDETMKDYKIPMDEYRNQFSSININKNDLELPVLKENA